MPFLVAAIDFGTTYSGCAFSFNSDFEKDPTKISAKQWIGPKFVSLKAPTCALIKSDGKTLEAFGFEAESKYGEYAERDCHHDKYFFRQFKMKLYGKTSIGRNLRIEDVTGKELPAKTVFALSIRYFVDVVLKEIENMIGNDGCTIKDIHWVLTVPAIWNDAAKQFMREAAQKAGILSNNLSIALEPEAASLYCQQISMERKDDSVGKFKPGTTYVVVDAGGGTVDLTVHEVRSDGSLKELHKATGSDCGGIKVDQAFEKFINDISGFDAIGELKKTSMEDYIDLLSDFEMKKRSGKPTEGSVYVVRISVTLKDLIEKRVKRALNDQIQKRGYSKCVKLDKDRLKIEPKTLQEMFNEPMAGIVDHIQTILKKVRSCSIIVMVGGCSDSWMIQEEVKAAFSDKKVIIPDEASVAVLKGAVIFGHAPMTISERISKMTYGDSITHVKSSRCNHPPGRVYRDENGDKRCDNIFGCHIKEGTAVKLGEKQPEIISTPVYDDQSTMDFEIFASTSPDVHFTTERCCTKIGHLTIPITDKSLGKEREYGVSFMFGDTEIKVIVEDKATKRVETMFVDFLS